MASFPDLSKVGERMPPVPLTGLPAEMRESGGSLGYATFRPKQGPSGTWHWGLDLISKSGNHTEPVVAPETMKVTHVWTNNATPPFVGYGPAGVLGQGVSGVYHLLGHMDPTAWSASSMPKVGQLFDAGEQVGLMSTAISPPHVHWEVRIKPIDSPATRKGNTLDPIKWIRGESRVLDRQPSGSGMPWWVWALLGIAISRRGR